MNYVEFYKLNNDGSQTVIAKCLLGEDGIVLCEGNENIAKNLSDKGIKDYSNPDGPMLFPKDGLKFLEQLQYNFRSGYLNASDLIEE